MTKDGTEQLRALHKISIAKLEREVIGDVYVVTAYAENDTRRDSSTGAVSIKGLAGDSLANAYMKAETKAKRRATLSICGLGMLDESEIDTIKDAQIISVQEVKLLDDNEIKDILEKIKTSFYEESKTIEHLRKSFAEFKRYYPQLSEQIIELAQYRAAELNQPQKQIEDNSQGE
jgi:hypothetical protein